MKPIPIRLGGVPTGVARPPIEAAKAVESKSRVPYCGLSCPFRGCDSRKLRIETPIGNIIAVVAVLLIHIDRLPVTAA